ncbi:type II toxin-antitoxin system prevent-host-death family antitoxin [Georhizobium profundi]|nr:type II toxin-antitoxin system prevent-host-death family antitoxin [Georhizobium profundi]
MVRISSRREARAALQQTHHAHFERSPTVARSGTVAKRFLIESQIEERGDIEPQRSATRELGPFPRALPPKNRDVCAMKEFAAADLTGKTGDLLEAASVSPVAITKHRKPRYVIMSMERYENLTHDDDTRRAFQVDDLSNDEADSLISGLNTASTMTE